jgi:selenocysteine lyase/cysteine desulfurase
MNKRDFLKTSGLLTLGAVTNITSMPASLNVLDADINFNLKDEAFWLEVRKDYDLPTEFINLENGYYCVQPKTILKAFKKNIDKVNRLGAFYMRRYQIADKAKVATKLSDLVGCSKDNLIITRNTTESLDMIISGFRWQTGDEALFSHQDYGSMKSMFEQMENRYGIKTNRITIPNHPKNDDEIVNLYANAITPKTKLMMVPHIINITGQILPLKKIIDMAHRKGVQVMVDGAHALAHFQFKLSDFDCDYYGCSLHKWLSAPLGAGILYVKTEHIPNIWPLLNEDNKAIQPTNISYLNHTGTLPSYTDLTISDAIDHYLKIGAARKEHRLRYLQTYWTSKVRDIKGITLNTPQEAERNCAIANVQVDRLTPNELADQLLQKYKIYTVAINTETVKGCRVTPNVFTTLAELDSLVKALKELA